MTPDPASTPGTPGSPEPAWRDEDLDNPHVKADKAARVQKMFSAIAGSYDLNNRLHSMWQDQAWRRKAVRLCKVKADDVVLDVACGTGDLSLAFARRLWRMPRSRFPRTPQVFGVDFTHEMVRIAKSKSQSELAPNSPRSNPPIRLASTVAWVTGDAMRLPFPDASVDIVSIAFGIRNVADPALAIGEFHRVLRPGGRVCILEFSLPTNPVMRGLYNFYFKHVMPRTATLISGDRSGAYKYLPQSVNTFLGREQMVRMLTGAGFTDVTQTPMTFGIAVAYVGYKR